MSSYEYYPQYSRSDAASMGYKLITPPAVEPVTSSEAIERLRLDISNVIPAPSKPTVALASPVAPGNVDNGAHRYRVTFVTSSGETDGGQISDPVTVADKTVNGQVSLTAIPVGPSNVTARKIYRTAAGGSSYLLLATIANNTATTYTDNTADASLGAGVPSSNTAYDTSEVDRLITQVRSYAERRAGIGIITQTWQVTLHDFPAYWEPINLPRGPVQSITSITYRDASGATQTLSNAVYVLESSPQADRVSLAFGAIWPVVQCQANAVTITFTVGFGDAASNVPDDLKAAILLIVGDLYQNREAQGSVQLYENARAHEMIDNFARRLVG